MFFSDILHSVLGSQTTSPLPQIEIRKCSIDSRKVLGIDGEIFFAIDGIHNDGHDFVMDVYARGVRLFVLEKWVELPDDASIIQVPDSIQALQSIAIQHRKEFDIPVIGITGSNGKTIVKEWLSTLLSQAYRVVKSPKSYNSEVGVPLSVLETDIHHEIGVFEAGVSGANQMADLAEIIQPTLGIFTNIGSAHDDGFENRKQKIEEKALLFANTEKVICRFEHEEIKAVLKEKAVTWSYQNREADYYFERQNNHFVCHAIGLNLNLPFANEQSVENALHACLVSHLIGIQNNGIEKGVQDLRAVPMRLELKKAINECHLINDSYNNDLQGLEVALDFMKTRNPHQPKTLVLSDILQSGLSNEALYEKVKTLIEAKQVDRLITVGESVQLLGAKEHFKSTSELLSEFPTFMNETILLKGARDFAFEDIAERLIEKTHITALEVNMEALRHNLNAYRERIQGKTKLMVMVKAFGYGSGLNEVAAFLEQERVDYLGVAYADEAISLRKAGLKLPIMIMSPLEDQFEKFEKYNLEPEIYQISMLRKLIEGQHNLSIHLKLETGMNRLGFKEDDLDELVDLLSQNKVAVKGIFTHLSSSDDADEDAYSEMQAEKFKRMSNRIVDVLGYQPILHILNSAGMVRFPQYHFDMVRLGIGLYGYDPTNQLHLQAVSSLKTHVSQVKSLTKGDTVGYSRKGVMKQDGKIAILPIGYADGYLRTFGNGKAKVNIGGRLYPTIGNICMDMTMVDISDSNVQEGDEVILLGDNPTLQNLSDWMDTIPYEVLTTIGQRVNRRYVSE